MTRARRAAAQRATASSTPGRCGRWRTRCACGSTTSSASTGRRPRARSPSGWASRRGSTSYHLRALAKHDLIREGEDRGTGRERWWERPVGGVSFANPDAMATPAGRAATQVVMNEFLRNRNEQLLDFVEPTASRGEDEHVAGRAR